MSEPRITRDDLEAKFRELDASAHGPTDAARTGIRAGLVVAVVVVVVGAYLVGRRRGRRRNRTVVEVHRL
jgi:hypothetical protein